MIRRLPAPVLLAGLALGALYLVTRLRIAGVLPYFLDEGIYAQYSYQGAHATSQLFVSLVIDKPPLQAWLGIPFQWLGANPLVAIRLVSVVAGLVTLWPLYALGRRAGGRLAGLLAAAFAVLIPFLLVNDGVGIEEPLVLACMAGALILTLRLGEQPTVGRALPLAAVLTVGVLSKQSAQLALALVPTGLIVFDFSPVRRAQRLVRFALCGAGAVAVAVGAELLLRASHYWAIGQQTDRMDPLVRSLGSVLRHPFATAPHAWRMFEPALSGYITIPLIVLAALGGLSLWRTHRRLTAVLLLWVVLPAAAALIFTRQPYPRHLMYVLPPVLVLMAAALGRGFGYASTRLPAPAAIALGTLVAVALSVPALRFDGEVLAHPASAHYPGADDIQYVTGVPAGGAWPHVAAAIRARAGGRPVAVFDALGDPNILRFLLARDPNATGNRYRVIDSPGPAAAMATFAFQDESPFSNPAAAAVLRQGHFRVIGRYRRVRSTVAVTLLERPGS